MVLSDFFFYDDALAQHGRAVAAAGVSVVLE